MPGRNLALANSGMFIGISLDSEPSPNSIRMISVCKQQLNIILMSICIFCSDIKSKPSQTCIRMISICAQQLHIVLMSICLFCSMGQLCYYFPFYQRFKASFHSVTIFLTIHSTKLMYDILQQKTCTF